MSGMASCVFSTLSMIKKSRILSAPAIAASAASQENGLSHRAFSDDTDLTDWHTEEDGLEFYDGEQETPPALLVQYPPAAVVGQAQQTYLIAAIVALLGVRATAKALFSESVAPGVVETIEEFASCSYLTLSLVLADAHRTAAESKRRAENVDDSSESPLNLGLISMCI